MSHKLTKNYLAILAYQCVTIFAPIFTTPYVSRVLGAEMIGVDAYVYSYVQLFMLVVLSGFPSYSKKVLARAATVKEEQQVFSELFSFQLIVTVLTMIGYGIFINLFSRYRLLFLLYGFSIISTGLDTSWYFIGKERISRVMFRNIAVRLIALGATFIWVKAPTDIWVFVLINAGSLFLGQLVTGAMAFKEVSVFKLQFKTVKQHIQPILVLFIVPCMTMLTLSLTKIVLEKWSGATEVGMYNQAYKLYTMIASFISTITAVLLPRMSRFYSQAKHQEVKKYLHFSIQLICASAIPLSAGIISVANQFVPWFLGQEFKSVTPVLMIVSLNFVLKGLTDVFGIQFLVVANRNTQYAWAVVIGSIINMLVCYILLNLGFQAMALAWGLVIGTLVTLLFEIKAAQRAFELSFLAKCLLKYGGFSLLMGVIVYFVPLILAGKTLFSLALQIIIGVASYAGMLFISKDSLLSSVLKGK